jgi:hypothetical protein
MIEWMGKMGFDSDKWGAKHNAMGTRKDEMDGKKVYRARYVKF